MFEIGKTYINNNEYAGKNINLPFGRTFYCPKEFTVVKDNGPLKNLQIHSYEIVDDKGQSSTIDDDDFKTVTLKN